MSAGGKVSFGRHKFFGKKNPIFSAFNYSNHIAWDTINFVPTKLGDFKEFIAGRRETRKVRRHRKVDNSANQVLAIIWDFIVDGLLLTVYYIA